MILHWKGCEEENLPFLRSSPWLCLVELNIFPSPNYKQFNKKQPYKHHQSNHSIPTISPIHHNPRFVNQITNSSQTHIKNQPNLMKSMTSWCPRRVREVGKDGARWWRRRWPMHRRKRDRKPSLQLPLTASLRKFPLMVTQMWSNSSSCWWASSRQS